MNIINQKVLDECGFTPEEINHLEEDHVIKAKAGDNYRFISNSDLFAYASMIVNTEMRKLSEKIYFLNMKVDPNFHIAAKRLFLYYLDESDYEKALYYLPRGYRPGSEDFNYYLFVLDKITVLPDEYQATVATFKKENLINPVANDDEQKVMDEVWKLKFKRALSILNKSIYGKSLSFHHYVERTLLNRAINEQNKDYQIIEDYLNGKKYCELYDYLKHLDKLRRIGKSSDVLFALGKALINLQEKGYIEEKNINVSNMADAIEAGKLNIAVDLLDLDTASKPVRLMFNELLNMIRLQSFDYPEIITKLKEHNFKDALDVLTKYLEVIGCLEFKNYIVNLIKLSIYQKDLEYKIVGNTLLNLKNNEFTYDEENYTYLVESAYNDGNYELAKIYIEQSYSLEFLKDVPEKVKELAENIRYKVEYEEYEKEIDRVIISEAIAEINQNAFNAMENLSPLRRDELRSLLRYYSDIYYFTVTHDNKAFFVLKKNLPSKGFDFKAVNNEARTAYKNNDYERSIELNKELLSHGYSFPSAFLKMGYLYLKSNDLKRARVAFIIAKNMKRGFKDDLAAENIIKDLDNRLRLNLNITKKLI